MVWDTDDGLHWIHNVPELHLEPRQRPFTSRARPPSRTFAYTYGVLNGVETLLGALSAHYAPEHFPLQFCRGLHSCILRMRENNLRRVELNQLIEALANYWKGQGLYIIPFIRLSWMDRDTITIPMRTLKAMISWQHNPNNPVASFYAQMRDYHNLDFDGTVYIVPHTKQELSAPQRWCPSGFCYCSREIELAEALAMVRDE